MKRILTLILVFSMICVSSLPTYAIKGESQGNKSENIKVIENSNGTYTPTSEKKSLLAKKTNVESVYSLKDGTLIMAAGEDLFIEVDRVEGKLSDISDIQYVLDNYEVPEAVENDLMEKHQMAVEGSNFDATFSLTLEKKPLTRGSITNYYTWNGHAVKDVIISYYSIEHKTQEVISGPDTVNYAETAFNLLLIAAGTGSGALHFVASGVSLLTAFSINNGTTVFDRSYQDYVSMGDTYDVSTKYTYLDLNTGSGYQLGLISQYVYVTELRTKTFLVSNYVGDSNTEIEGPFPGVASPNYWDPAPIAYYHLGAARDERIEGDYGLAVWRY